MKRRRFTIDAVDIANFMLPFLCEYNGHATISPIWVYMAHYEHRVK